MQDEARRSKERDGRGGNMSRLLGKDEDRKNPAEKRREEQSRARMEDCVLIAQ